MTTRLATATLALGLAALLGGCASNTPSARHAAVRDNPTPELDTLYQRPAEIDNRLTLTTDENLRMFVEDWGRVWLLDRPSRLTREPVPR
jgi:type IV pilus biogenesis protein CpaD/CtpE